MEADITSVMKELKLIKHELEEIKENMPDREMFLTADETCLLHESFASENKGELKSTRDLMRELGL